MRWTERQRAMLREMGVRHWWPDTGSTSLAEAEEPVRARAVANTVDASPLATTVDPPPAAKTVDAPPALRPAAARVAEETVREPARVPGLAPADWLVVAEPLDAPDAHQAQLLDNMLRAIGVGLVAPSRERRAVFLALGSADTNAVRGAADDALRAALATVAPRCVLAFGRAAAAALVSVETPLGGLRGRVHAHGIVPVVVTFSLAFLLRHPTEKAKAWADLCLAARVVAEPAT